ncbi:hypothetical protein I0P70_13725 [Pontibacter sp. FD36]|uniref:hypothetical protein n=1 Tax=Pontibacter sp. FD36 TaxID=2789860 RepID=UPI0018A92D29|nr:hypothetical protein [Pontibacter sp. FD36]MBF8964308.1 hypothetical protein [Pontibacter sp. FD36]
MKKKDLLAKYSIEFKKKNFTNPVTGENRISKFVYTSSNDYSILADFFNDLQKPEEVKMEVLEVIEEVECRSLEEGETGSQSGVAVYINIENTKLVGFNSIGSYLEPDLIVPTIDFKLIGFAWLYFLEN